MKKCFRPAILMAVVVLTLVGCGNKETKQAIEKAKATDAQKDYPEANRILVEALRAREAKIRAAAGPSADAAAAADLTKKVQSDPEILQMERAQIVIYLHMERADLASAVYSDILGGNPNDQVIYETLRNEDPKIRTGAIGILGIAGKSETIPALIEASKDKDQEVRRAAVAALGTIKDPKAFDPLIAALKDSYWFTRSAAAEGLRQQKNPVAIKPLLDVLADSDSSVEGSAEKAVMVLCQEKGASADDFAARLNDANPKIVMVSAVCLALMKDRRATPVLLKLTDSSDPTTRLQALKALGETGDPSVIPVLRQTLKDSDVNVRGWSIIGLGLLMDKDSLPALRAIAANEQEPPKIRSAATASANHIEGKTPQGSPGGP